MASKTDHLANISLFSSCSKKELQRISKGSTEITQPAGTVLCEQDKPGRELFVILSGSATVHRNNRKVADMGPGDFVGEMSLLDRGPRSATVTTTSETDLLVLSQQEFFGALEDIPALARKFLTAIAMRLREADSRAYTH